MFGIWKEIMRAFLSRNCELRFETARSCISPISFTSWWQEPLNLSFVLQVENHDDFFSLEEGRVHVQDQRGYYVMYDSALADFK